MKKELNVIGLRVLHNGERRDNLTKVSLPSIESGTTDISGAGVLGTIRVPGTAQFNSSTFQVTYEGSSSEAADLLTPGTHSFEVRDVHDAWDSELGTISPKGSKYFLTGIFTGASGGDLSVGSIKTGTVTYEMIRYEVWNDGNQVILIDKLAFKDSINGTDYGVDIQSYLD